MEAQEEATGTEVAAITLKRQKIIAAPCPPDRGELEEFHNDSRDTAEDLDNRVKGMQQCGIPLR